MTLIFGILSFFLFLVVGFVGLFTADQFKLSGSRPGRTIPRTPGNPIADVRACHVPFLTASRSARRYAIDRAPRTGISVANSHACARWFRWLRLTARSR